MNFLKVLAILILTVTSLVVFSFAMLTPLLNGVDEPQWIKTCGLMFAVLCTWLVGKEKGVSGFFKLIYLTIHAGILVLYVMMLVLPFLFRDE